MRRIISIILSMLMIVSMCTFVSFGASAEDVAIPAEPTLEILTDTEGYTPLTLEMIFTEGRQGVEQKKDFDMAGKYYLAENITLPMTIDGTFTGELHGNGKTITVTTGPVFSNISGATISNVKLVTDADGISVATADHIAILAAIGGAVNVENVITEGIVKNTSATSVTASAAGLIGMLSSENESTLTNCYNKAAVTGMNGDPQGTAGIVGHVAAGQLNLIDCVNIGAITGYNDAAGIVCYAKAFVDAEGCINAGVVKSSNDAAGGIMAHTTKGFDIDFCDNIQTVTAGGNSAAGIVANMGGSDSVDRSITNCTNSAVVTGKAYVAGIVGYYNTAKTLNIANCENTANISTTAANGTLHGAAGICCYAATYVTIDNCKNSGTIWSGPRQAAGIIGYVKAGGMITNCINTGDCTVTVLKDGNPTTDHANHIATMAAGIAAYVLGDSKADFEISNCSNSGKMSSYERAGGIVGLIGAMKNSLVSDCYNEGDVVVTGYDNVGYAGGIAGTVGVATETSTIKNCVNDGAVTTYFPSGASGSRQAGGIVAHFDGAKGSGTAANPNYSSFIMYCLNNGNVTSYGNYAGGIYGGISGSSSAFHGPTVKYCGVTGDVINENEEGYAGGIGGYTCIYIYEVYDNFFVGELEAKTAANAYAFAYTGCSPLESETDWLDVEDFNRNYFLDTVKGNLAFAGWYTDEESEINTSDDITYAMSALAEGYTITSADVASGKLAYLMQEATGEDEIIWGQNIGIDETPVLFGEKVAKLGDEYVNIFLDERFVALNQGYKYVVVAKAPENAKVTFTFNGEIVEAVGEATDRAGYYEFVFDGVAPQFIANDITTNLYLGDTLVETVTESILDYCESLYAELDDGAMKTLVEKVYLYGVAARDYVVAKELHTAEELPAVSSDVITATAGAAPEAAELEIGVIGEGASFVGANVIFDSTNKVIIKIKLDEGVDISTVTLNDMPITSAPDANGVYSIVTEAVYASQFDLIRLYELEVNGVLVADLVYNVCTYASRMANNESASAEMKALAIATYEYGVAARNVLK